MSDQLEAPQEPIHPSPADTPAGPPRAQSVGSAEPAGRYAHWERIDVALTTRNGGSQTVSYRAWKDSLRQSDIDPDYLELKYQDPETPDRMGTAMFPRDAVVSVERRPILTPRRLDAGTGARGGRMSELTEKARALADAARPGPWTTSGHESDAGIDAPEHRLIYDEGGHSVADAQFIAEARTLVPALCDEIDAWEAEGRELRSDHTALRALTAAQAARIRELEAMVQAQWPEGTIRVSGTES